MPMLQQLDQQIVLWVSENLQYDILNPVMIGISTIGNMGIVFILMAVIMLLIGIRKGINWRNRGVLLIVCLAVTAIFANIILKPWIARIRPYDVLGLPLLINPPHDFSFPSGHTAAAFATAVAVFSFHKKAGIALIIFAIVMGFSRLYLSVHFPSDILCGALLGTAVSSIVVWFWKKGL